MSQLETRFVTLVFNFHARDWEAVTQVSAVCCINTELLIYQNTHISK
jgi:hypothetical protein